jgi:hypothetical protein
MMVQRVANAAKICEARLRRSGVTRAIRDRVRCWLGYEGGRRGGTG